MINRICKACERTFLVYPSDLDILGRCSFCSRKCKSAFAKKKNSTPITQEMLKEITDYNPITGKMIWRKNVYRAKAGDSVGYIGPQGYWVTVINQKPYRVHRLIWLYVFGYLPEKFIDHINGVRHDNRLENLREATHAENTYNRKIQSNNKCRFKGVTRYKNLKKQYRAQIVKERKVTFLGYFYTPEEAHEAYLQAAKKIHGEFFNSG